MARESTNNTKNGENQLISEYFDKNRRLIETLSYTAITGTIISIIFLMFNLRLFAGVVMIIAASIGLYLLRKVVKMITNARNTINAASSSSEKKDDVITDFSHKIREPLNNLVIITDMLMESGLEKKQKELLETFIASTTNMVSTVNELTMQSAGSLSLEPRKHIRFNLLFTINLKKEKETANETHVGLRIQTDKNIILIDEKKAAEHSLAARLISFKRGSFTQEFGKSYTVLNMSLPFTNIIREPKQQIASTKIEELIQKEKVHKELKDINILLVEDNLINQKITHLTLKPLVHSIDTASNGKEALDKFGTTGYDLILMDIQMPVMSGLVAAEKIRALESSTSTHVPIIAITANAMLGDKEKCISAGIDDYISKPFQPSALIDKIKKYL